MLRWMMLTFSVVAILSAVALATPNVASARQYFVTGLGYYGVPYPVYYPDYPGTVGYDPFYGRIRGAPYYQPGGPPYYPGYGPPYYPGYGPPYYAGYGPPYVQW